MPRTLVHYYKDADGAPVLQWLEALAVRNPAAYANCLGAMRRLRDLGHELRRPTADYLRDGIHELRAHQGRVQYRILYFFHGRNRVLLACGLTKEGKVPEADIELALKRKRRFEGDPDAHTHEEG